MEEAEGSGGQVAQEAPTKKSLEGWFPMTSRVSCLAMPTAVRSQSEPWAWAWPGDHGVDLGVHLGAHF